MSYGQTCDGYLLQVHDDWVTVIRLSDNLVVAGFRTLGMAKLWIAWRHKWEQETA